MSADHNYIDLGNDVTLISDNKRQTMPAEIAKAIVKVMAGVNKLSKDGKNIQGGYTYTSVDSFFEMIRPLMAEAAIFDVLFEVSSKTFERVGNYDKKSTWLECEFDVYFYHESGAQFGPLRRKIQVVASGPQSYLSAQSFVEKGILRSMFKIATGDIDPDQHPTTELPVEPNPDKNVDQRQTDDLELVYDWMRRAKKEYHGLIDANRLRGWWTSNLESMREVFGSPPIKEFDTFKAEYLDYAKTLSPSPVADDVNPQAAQSAVASPPVNLAGNDQGVTSGRVPSEQAKMLDDDVPF